jgi:rubrerythrin
MDFLTASATVNAVEVLDTPALELMARLENSGQDFYELLAERVGNDDAAALLRRNGREEAGHARRILRALSLKEGEGYQAPAEVFEPLAVELPDTVDATILGFIVAGELDGDAGYQRWADREPDPEVARLLRLNGREETRHGERVREVIAILEAAGS